MVDAARGISPWTSRTCHKIHIDITSLVYALSWVERRWLQNGHCGIVTLSRNALKFVCRSVQANMPVHTLDVRNLSLFRRGQSS